MNKFFVILALTLLLSACGKEPSPTQHSATLLTVYKDPNCGCCQHWIDHVEDNGYPTKTVHPQDIWAIKSQYNIRANLQSCHTALTQEGYVFEGHVPAKFIDKFLANPPQQAVGLTVPAMVVGSPGMEMGDKFKAYHILQLNRDGTTELYQAIDSYQQQF